MNCVICNKPGEPEPRFNYVVCKAHEGTPPTIVSVIVELRQLLKTKIEDSVEQKMMFAFEEYLITGNLVELDKDTKIVELEKKVANMTREILELRGVLRRGG